MAASPPPLGPSGGWRTLFVHQSFPGQYRHLAAALAGQPGHEVVGLGEREVQALPGVRFHRYSPPPGAGGQTHRYLRPLEAAVRRGQAAARAAVALRAQGFRPELICCHPGWGEALFLRDVFPEARLLLYCEYFYHAVGGDVGFGAATPPSLDEAARIRLLNANNLLALEAADWGHTPTQWQRSRFPPWAQARITTLHEGVDTAVLAPDATARFRLADGRWLGRDEEVVTYVARGLEPHRGFPSLMRAAPELLRRRPRVQLVVVGDDAPHYGPPPRGGGTWRAALARELGERVDWSRLHFTGRVAPAALRQLLQVSRAHVYLTSPFVLSWSLLEAMACACPIVASATPPVEEVLTDGQTARLVDFHAPAALAEQVIALLEAPELGRVLGRAARARAVRDYDLRSVCLPAGLALLQRIMAGLSRDGPAMRGPA